MLDLIFRICKYRSQKKGIYESRHQQRRPDRDSVTNKPLPTPFVPFTLPPPPHHTHTHTISYQVVGFGFLCWRLVLKEAVLASAFLLCFKGETKCQKQPFNLWSIQRGKSCIGTFFFSCFEMLSNIGHFSKTPQTILMLLLFDCISKGYTCGLKPKSRPPLKTTGTKIQTSRGTLFKICDFICDSKHSVTSWSFNLVVTLQWVFLWSAFTVHSFKAQ